MSILGIDVSTAQGNIDWNRVVADNIAFAYLKATEGLQTDSHHEARAAYFRANWVQAGNAGLPRGAYHFFRPNQDGHLQAEVFLQALQGMDTGELPPMVDVEAENGVPFVPRSTFVAQLSECLNHITERVGVRPFVYTNTPYWNAHLDASFGDYPLWIANYGQDMATGPVLPVQRPLPLPQGFTDFVLWQFAEFGRVQGIAGAGVDLNVFRGTLPQLQHLGRTPPSLTVQVNGTHIADADAFLTPQGVAFGWVRPLAAAIRATILDFSASSVTLQRGGQSKVLTARITAGKAFVHLDDLEMLPGVSVAFEPATQTVTITTA